MAKLTTEEKIKEMCKLIPDHSDTLISFGYQMYRDGIITGGLAVISGFVVGELVSCFGEMLSKKI